MLTPLLLAALVAAPEPSTPLAERVVIVALDGFGADWFIEHRSALPTLSALADAGTWGRSRTITPSVTWPAHTTIVTGVHPDKHGVVGNRWIDRKTGRSVSSWKPTKTATVRVPTLYDVVHEAGKKTAALFWPQVSGAPTLDFSIPEIYDLPDFKKFVTPKLQRELKPLGVTVERMTKLSVSEVEALDLLTARIVDHVVGTHQPELMLVHFTAGDTHAHRSGPRSKRYVAGLHHYDAMVGRVLAAVDATGKRASTSIFVVSDHGFFPTRNFVDAKAILNKGGAAKALTGVANNGHLAYLYFKEGTPAVDIQAAQDLLRKHPLVERVLSPGDFGSLGLPTPTTNPTIGDLVAITVPDHAFGTVKGGAVVGPAKYKGTHGYPPEPANNHPLFIAAGAGIKKNPGPISLRNVDIAPTAAALLGLKMTDVAGVALFR